MQPGCAIWLTGLPASGKTTIAQALAVPLQEQGLPVEILDGDEIRRSLSADLGFSAQDREEHNRRVIFVAKLLIRNSIITIIPLISPLRAVREFARQELGQFLEVWVKCSLAECIRRDPKGLYAKALRGEIPNMTGIQDPYEEPLNPEVVVDTEALSVEECVMHILAAAAQRGYVGEWVPSRRGGSPMTNPFVFLVGCPRSGTTLLKRMGDAHPQIAIGDGRGLVRRFQDREGLTPEGFLTPELAEKKRILSFMSREEFTGFVHGLLESGQPVSYASLITRMSDLYAEAERKPFIGYKVESTGHNVLSRVRSMPTLHSLWPRAKLIHIIRDGRDVCLSAMSWRKAPGLAQRFATWTEDPLTTAALWWEWQVRLLREDGRPLGPNLYYEIRYEALVTRPEAECRALCQFLGVPYDDAMLRFHVGREKDDPNLDAKHAWRPIIPGLRDWRKEMSSEDVERFEAVAGDLLDELGYPRGAGRPSPQALEHAARLRSLFEGRPLPQGWQAARRAAKGG